MDKYELLNEFIDAVVSDDTEKAAKVFKEYAETKSEDIVLREFGSGGRYGLDLKGDDVFAVDKQSGKSKKLGSLDKVDLNDMSAGISYTEADGNASKEFETINELMSWLRDRYNITEEYTYDGLLEGLSDELKPYLKEDMAGLYKAVGKQSLKRGERMARLKGAATKRNPKQDFDSEKTDLSGKHAQKETAKGNGAEIKMDRKEDKHDPRSLHSKKSPSGGGSGDLKLDPKMKKTDPRATHKKGDHKV